jgi:predicted RNase H-related nuclease YkuK (DUF458 family)
LKKENNMKQFHIERVTHIHDSDTGNHLYIGPDREGLDCVEIRDVSSKGEVEQSIFMSRELAIMVARAILELYAGSKSESYFDIGR